MKSAALHIASHDPDENPFDINLTARALSFTEDADGDRMNDASELQMRTLGFKWDDGTGTQPTLVATYYASANGTGLYTPAQVQVPNVGTPLIQRNPVPGFFTLTIGLQKSTNVSLPNSFLPLPFTTQGTTINGQGKIEFQFSVPDNAASFRLQAP